MKKTLVVLGIGALACFSTTEAATINVARGIGNPGVTVSDSTGTALSSGGFYMAVGTYAVVPTVTDYASLLTSVDALVRFGNAGVSNSTTLAGILQLSTGITSNGGATPELWNTKEIFVVVGNGADRVSSTDFAILRTTAGTFFPANVANVGTVTFSVPTGAALAPISGAGSVTGNSLTLAGDAIPEPSTMLLGALGALGLLRRRR